jgi:hypothetical protein
VITAGGNGLALGQQETTMTKLNSNELSIAELDFVIGGGDGDHNGTGSGPGTGPGMWIRLGKDIAGAIGNVIKIVGTVIPH